MRTRPRSRRGRGQLLLLLVALPACIASRGTPPDLPAGARIDPAAGIMNLDHLVFIVLENRSFDHYFGTFPGADGIPMDAKGRPKVCLPDPVEGGCHRPYHDTNFIDQGGPHGEVGSAISINGG